MDTTTIQPLPQYQFVGGFLCLDFANTADWHEREQPVELLTSYSDLLTWGRQAGVLDEEATARLTQTAEAAPEAAVAAYAQAITMREALFRIFRGIARQQSADSNDLALLNRELARTRQHRQIVPGDTGYAWTWNDQDTSLDSVLWSVAQSAADLLTSATLQRVRQCAGDPCGWLFYDTSRNRSRRWCTMDGCGNRAKARRFYERQRGETLSRPGVGQDSAG